MQTRLFEWAEGKGIGMEELSRLTGYGWRYLYAVKSGEVPVTRAFRERVSYRLDLPESSLFFDSVSVKSDRTAVTHDATDAHRA